MDIVPLGQKYIPFSVVNMREECLTTPAPYLELINGSNDVNVINTGATIRC